jgi:hypothetical protein
VQWHPEELAKTDPHSSSLFYEFVRAAAGDWRVRVPAEWPAFFASLRRPAGAARSAPVSRNGLEPSATPSPVHGT